MYIYISCIYIYIHTEKIFPKEKTKMQVQQITKDAMKQKRKWIEQMKPPHLIYRCPAASFQLAIKILSLTLKRT